MKLTAKPYRLINDLEMKLLQHTFEIKLTIWNGDYALFPLSCTLSHSPTTMLHDGPCWAKAKPTYKINTSDLSIIKHSLFGDESTCFDNQTETLFITLLNQLLGTESFDPIEDWFYPGTPSLALALSCAGKTITIYIHPQWALTALPSQLNTKKPIVTLHNVLSTQQVNLHIELNPLPLKLSDIMRLQIGDVIQTDHAITDPAQLCHQQTPICNVDIGKFHSFKSIQITR